MKHRILRQVGSPITRQARTARGPGSYAEHDRKVSFRFATERLRRDHFGAEGVST